MEQQYLLPNWTYTGSVKEYQAAWGELVAVVREFFPQYEQISFDPQFALKHPYLAELLLGVHEVQAMKEYRDRKQAEVAALKEEVSLLRAEVRKLTCTPRVVWDLEVVKRAHAEKA